MSVKKFNCWKHCQKLNIFAFELKRQNGTYLLLVCRKTWKKEISDKSAKIKWKVGFLKAPRDSARKITSGHVQKWFPATYFPSFKLGYLFKTFFASPVKFTKCHLPPFGLPQPCWPSAGNLDRIEQTSIELAIRVLLILYSDLRRFHLHLLKILHCDF